MKKIYESPVMETMVLSAQLMEGGSSITSTSGGAIGGGWPAPKPRPDKPF